MATIPSDSPDSSSHFLRLVWQRWKQRRQRNITRRLAQVHFRLTREGLHFVGVLLFIFFGAVIRDINLLILLAGAMLGLLLLQWRFNTRTLIGLRASRRLSQSIVVGRSTLVSIRVVNPKRWLGAWLVLVEDTLYREKPVAQRIAVKAATIVDEVRPQGSGGGNYELTFRQRGKYRVGPSTLSTRFPIGLGRGWRTLNNAAHIIVHPSLGQLTPRIERLFHRELHGHSKASSNAGANETEFYGLRPWATGDSRRWIHWRTTARLGELSVRQFERQQHRQLNILLDLHGVPEDDEIEQSCEMAIAFVATLASSNVKRGGDRMAVAIAADQTFASVSVQSAVLVDNLLGELSVIAPCPQPELTKALKGIHLPLLKNPNLLVVSTRSNQLGPVAALRETDSVPDVPREVHLDEKVLERLKVRWLNVSAGDLEPYFAWTSQK
ncbi:DUF58 domain-containing protein [Aureliella helgolandensis]|uniref:DUF58 domain-containing protein n=1 Tax=Aureliella helgolandensis TaxID=2527968 RepID=A0A518GC58_9BACT|nr:DUF58 domain-containing protein [Aureliella helgolandensis]QDV26174.1 hypothetical protein Q31a_45460 [Aureliella helgolandensis]